MGPSPKFGQSSPMDCPYLHALKHDVLLTEFGCHEWSIDGPAPASAVPQIEGLSPNPAANAPQSAPRNVIAPLTLLRLTLLHSSQTVDLNLDGKLRRCQYPRNVGSQLFGPFINDISSTRREQTLSLQSSQRFKPYRSLRHHFWPSLSHTSH